MLQVTQHTADRLTLHDRRVAVRVLAVALLVNSLASLALIYVQASDRIAYEGALALERIPALLVFVLAGAGFVAFSLFLLLNVSRGVRVTFDRHAETVTIESARALRRHAETHSIYAVSHVRTERNDEIRAYALILVLRSGAQIPLATLPQHEQNHLESLVATVRGFLRG